MFSWTKDLLRILVYSTLCTGGGQRVQQTLCRLQIRPHIMLLSRSLVRGRSAAILFQSRGIVTAGTSSRAAKDEGSIADIFTSLTNEEHNALPDRFSDLKKELWSANMVESWREVLAALEPAVEETAATGSEVRSRRSLDQQKLTVDVECSPSSVRGFESRSTTKPDREHQESGMRRCPGWSSTRGAYTQKH